MQQLKRNRFETNLKRCSHIIYNLLDDLLEPQLEMILHLKMIAQNTKYKIVSIRTNKV